MAEAFTSAEIEQLRADTAGCSLERIFFNNAGASLQPRVVVDRVVEHLRLEERIGAYEAADHTEQERKSVYASVARLLGADAAEIAITESATRAWDMAFYSLQFIAGDRILTAQNEYSSNYIALLQMAKRTGAEIVCVPAASGGEIDLDALEHLLKQGSVKLIALTHIATNNGMVQPAAAVGRLARQYGSLFLLDACQSAGQMHLDVRELGCDMLSATGRKFLRGAARHRLPVCPAQPARNTGAAIPGHARSRLVRPSTYIRCAGMRAGSRHGNRRPRWRLD